MELNELNALLDEGQTICEGSEEFTLNAAISLSTREALSKINESTMSDEEASEAFLGLIGAKAEGFRFFRPIYLDYGRNLHLGDNVFINALTTIQDQGGVYIGNRVYIGHRVSIATLNHAFDPPTGPTFGLKVSTSTTTFGSATGPSSSRASISDRARSSEPERS